MNYQKHFKVDSIKMFRFVTASFFILAFVGFQQTEGHGMVMDPVNRASRWRVDPSAPADYTDNEGFCGGYAVSFK